MKFFQSGGNELRQGVTSVPVSKYFFPPSNRQGSLQDPEHFHFHLFLGPVRVDPFHPEGFPLGDAVEGRSDPLVKIPFFLLDPVPRPIAGVAVFAFETLVDR
jgi:hypothetical protein